MPGIICTRVPSIRFHHDGTLIVLKDYVIQDGISLMLQKHDKMYVVWQLITYPHYFRLCQAFGIYIFLSGPTVQHALYKRYFSPCVSFHVRTNSVCCIYPHVEWIYIEYSNVSFIFDGILLKN